MPRLTLASAAIILANAVFATTAPQSTTADYGNAMPAARAAPTEDAAVSTKELAAFFCNKIHPNTSAEWERCTMNFLSGVEGAPGAGGEVTVCRGGDTITLVAPAAGAAGETYRLALLELDDDRTPHGEETELWSRKAVLSPGESAATWRVAAGARGRLRWIALDRAGRRRGRWRGAAVAARRRPLPVRGYRAPARYHRGGGGGLGARFAWNQTEDGNCDYTAWYTCGGAMPTDFPTSVAAGDSLVLEARKLPFASSCQFHVSSTLGAQTALASFNFTTPACADVLASELCHESMCAAPERPSAVSTVATFTSWRQGAPLYSVRVTWAAPAHAPHNYTVHLADTATDYTDRLLVNGGASEAQFNDAPLSGQYWVEVMAAARAGRSSEVVVGNALPIDPSNIPVVESVAEKAAFCRSVDSITVIPPEAVAGEAYLVALLLLVDNETASDEQPVENPTMEYRAVIEESGKLLRFSGLDALARYRVSVTALDGARRRVGPWRGAVSAPRAGSPTPVREFDPPDRYVADGRGLNATLTWNRTEDDNCDYSAWYECNSTTWPTDPIIYVEAGQNLMMEAHKLPFESDCKFHIISELGDLTTLATFNFTTPSCFAVLSPDLCRPERPGGVSTIARESSWLRDAPLYDVRVTWTAPAHAPHNYTVRLADTATNYTDRLLVDGNKSEALFVDAPLSGQYQVMVTASSRAGNTSSEITFGEALPRDWKWTREVAWAMASGAAALALGAVLWLLRRSSRQRRVRRHFYFEQLEQNAPKEASVESGLLPAGDAFELRPESVALFEVLGEGAFGVVRKGWHADLGREVAVKMLKDMPTIEDVRAFRQEMEVMKSVGPHPHVVSLLGCVASAGSMMIIVEYCARGDLLHYLRCSWDVMASKRNQKLFDEDLDLLKKSKPNPNAGKHGNFIANKLYDVQGICETELTAVDLLSFCRQIAMGMEFLASNRVVHRDLAARNVLVCSDRTVKIADFGLSRDVYEDNQYRKTGSGKLPVKWMALESLTHQLYTTQSDVWSFGVLLWEAVTLGGAPYPGVAAERLPRLLCGGYRMARPHNCANEIWSFGVLLWEAVTLGGAPYPGVAAERLPRLLRGGYRMARPHNCANEIYELMLACWRTRPKDRPTFTQLHQKLDALLNGTCHKEYLSLDILDLRDIEGSQKVPPDKISKYWGLISRDKRSSSHATGRLTLYQKYVKPLYSWRSQFHNHYSLTPTQANPPALF